METKNTTKKNIAVVVTWNRKDLLEKCIDSLLSQSVCCDILIVDNASNDGTAEMVAKKYSCPKVSYINTGKNLGCSGGNQIGISEAVKRGYDYIWVLDDDTWPSSNALSELINVDSIINGNWGFLSSVALWTDGSLCRMNRQKKGLFQHVKEKDYLKPYTKVKMASFVSLLIKASVIKEVGLPIAEYFIWTDDYEYTGRISRRYPCYMVPTSKVVHAMKMNMRPDFAREVEPERIARYKYLYRNDTNCYRQYGIIGWSYIVSKGLYTMVSILLHSRENKVQKIRVIFDGFFSGLSFSPKIKKVEDI